MISGGNTHCAGPALAAHLMSADNDSVAVLARRGVLSDDLCGAINEMRIGAGTRTKRPVYHVHADPSGDHQAEQMAAFWRRFEDEFGLDDHAFVEVVHEKHGRVHSHRVYQRLGPSGRLENFRHDRARREKIARQVESEFSQELVPGAHTLSVARRLALEGDLDLATRLSALPLPAPGAAVSPDERQQGERTGWSRAEAEDAIYRAWLSSDDARSLQQALLAEGLALANGHKVPVITNQTGDVWPLGRLIGAASHRAGARIGAAAVRTRLEGVELPSADIARAMLATRLEADPLAVQAEHSRPSPVAAPPVPAPPIGRVAPGPVLHGPEGRFAFEKGESEMSRVQLADHIHRQTLKHGAEPSASIGPRDRPDLPATEKQRRSLARKEKHKSTLLNKHYSSSVFKRNSHIKFVKEDPHQGLLTIVFHDGRRIVDDGETISLHGQVDEEAVKAMMAIAEAKGWSRLRVTGNAQFKDAAWIEAQRRGVTIANWSPSADTIRAWRLELETKREKESGTEPLPPAEVGRAADLEIEPNKERPAPSVQQEPIPPDSQARAKDQVLPNPQERPPMPPVRRDQPAAIPVDMAVHRDQLARQIGAARLTVADLAQRARNAVTYAQNADEKFQDIKNGRNYETRKKIKEALEDRVRERGENVRNLKAKSRALLPWKWTAAVKAKDALPAAEARQRSATINLKDYTVIGPLKPQFGKMYDDIWKVLELEKPAYRAAKEKAEEAQGARREAERQLAVEAQKLAEMEARALEMGIDPDQAPARDLDDDYEGPTIGAR
jgi:hypothetical protein